MGCGTNTKCSATTDSLHLDLNPSIDIQLDKWNSRQILLARAKFKKGLTKESPFVLSLEGFINVFPELTFLPENVIRNTFALFDNDSSGGIDFKEFCYILTILVYGSMEDQQAFAFNLFDIDKDGEISTEELALTLQSIDGIKQKSKSKSTDYTAKAKEILNGKKSLNEIEFTQELTMHIHLKELLEIFEVIPSISSEYKIIHEIIERSKTEKQRTCYVLNYKWWNMWYNYVKKSKEIKGSVFASIAKEDFWLKVPDMNALNSRRKSKVNYMDAKVLEDTTDINDEMARPGEIDNTNLEGPIKGTLKDNLKLMRDYILIPNEAWKHLIEWYGGGPEFERVITNYEGNTNVELYPLILYVVSADDNGMPMKSYIPLVVSKSITMRELGKQIKVKFNKVNTECRIWYRLMMQGSQWELVKNFEKTIKSEKLSNGDKVILEHKCGEIWPRDHLRKDELQWEIRDKVDIYIESKKAWEEGIITNNKPGYLTIKVTNGTYDVAKNSSIIAPYRTHTIHNIQSVLTPDIQKKLIREFKPLPNLGNT